MISKELNYGIMKKIICLLEKVKGGSDMPEYKNILVPYDVQSMRRKPWNMLLV